MYSRGWRLINQISNYSRIELLEPTQSFWERLVIAALNLKLRQGSSGSRNFCRQIFAISMQFVSCRYWLDTFCCYARSTCWSTVWHCMTWDFQYMYERYLVSTTLSSIQCRLRCASGWQSFRAQQQLSMNPCSPIPTSGFGFLLSSYALVNLSCSFMIDWLPEFYTFIRQMQIL